MINDIPTYFASLGKDDGDTHRDSEKKVFASHDVEITDKSSLLYKAMNSVRHPTVETKWIFIDLAIGFVIAFIIMKAVTANLKSVKSRVDANEYVVPGSLALDQSYDRFLYSNVARTEKASSSSDNGSHTSSSGTSHGGTGGSF